MNPLKLLFRYGLTSLALCALESTGLYKPPSADSTAPSSLKAKDILLRQLELRDKQLTKATKRALHGLTGKGLSFFEEDQKNWTDWREEFFSDTSSQLRSAAELSEEELATWTEEVRRRTSWIHGLMDHRDQKDLTGFWSDGAGGYFSLVEQGDQIHFLASCARGATRHLGSIQGRAKRSGEKAVFTISEFSDEPTRLEFTLVQPWIILQGTNTGPYHGNSAYFDGHYVKIAPLSDHERQVVIQATRQQP
jgi:hypothetical protein